MLKGLAPDFCLLFELEEPNVEERLDFLCDLGEVNTVEGPSPTDIETEWPIGASAGGGAVSRKTLA